MNRILHVLAFISILFIGCQKELSFSNPNPNAVPVTATLQGNVVDENGGPAAGVTITVGTKTAVTDAKGYFRIKNAPLDKSASLVTATKAGYFKAFRVFSASKAVNQVKIKLLKKTLSGTLNSSAGGVVTLMDLSSVTFSANSFSKASGEAYSGTVNVYATVIDPASPDISETVPGSFLGNDKDGKKVILTSYGMMAVELESANGEKLQISAGNTAYLSFVIPGGLRTSAPTQLPLWYVDETTGIWKEEGTATKNGNFYNGTVKHFTYWNCDVSGPRVNLTARFVSQNGQPLIYTEVVIRPVSGYASAHGITDSLGQINGPVPANTNLIMEVTAPYPCYNIIYGQNIGPFGSDVNLGTIVVNNTQSLLTIQGRLLNCSGNPVIHGFAEIIHDNIVRFASTNASGNFSVTFTTCGSSQTTCLVMGVDSLAQQQGPVNTVAITTPVTNTGDITACGTSSTQFLSYTVDGVPVNLSSITPGDSFSASDTVGNNTTLVYLSGNRSQNEYLSLDFYSPGSTGTYALSYLSIGGFGMVTPLAGCTIVITSFPQPGGYYEGSFTGQFKDWQNITHNLNGTLRIKRRL
ncbi:MAG: hypothetical protein ABIT05_14700 [Chitinophagaceae bacterium]